MSVESELVELISQNDLAEKVYGRVISELRLEGIQAEYLKNVFSDPEIKIENEITVRFNNPAEQLPYERYRNIFITEKRIQTGKEFYKNYSPLIHAVTDSFGIDPFILISIVGVESSFGQNAEEFSVFNALHTIIHRIPRRERWVEKEMREYLLFCYRNNIPPLTVFGSYAGAFGFGQFLPSSYNQYAIDFDHDGVKDPYRWPDVLASVANYIKRHGYIGGSEDFSRNSQNWKALMAYNPSINYVRVVVELRNKLKVSIGN